MSRIDLVDYVLPLFLSYIATSTIDVPLHYLVQHKTIMLIIIF